jgi:arsenite/tail-anchored protein-transporting ATPase
VAQAKGGKPTLLISTDPAHSLADALIHPLSSVSRAVGGGRAVLHAVEIDARRALERWLAGRRSSLEQIALRGTWLDHEDVGRLLQLSLPGIDELAALLEIARAGRSRRFDLIVVDTAPTGHTLRMLAMPEMLGGLARVFDLMQEKHRVMVAALRGAYAPDDSDALIEEIAREASSLATLLRDPRMCRMSWVTLPEIMAVEETADASEALARTGIPLHEVIVNRTTPPPSARCGWCDGRRIIERQAVARLSTRLPGTPTIGVRARTVEPRGLRALGAIGTEIAEAMAVRSLSSRLGPVRVWRADAGDKRCGVEPIAGADTRLVLFGGKGGVGKTTCAAAAALALAARSPSRPVLLLSTDPAHSLADVLGQTIGDDPVRLRSGPANLQVREIDAARQLDTMRHRYASSIDGLFDRLTNGQQSGVRVDASQDRAVLHGLIDLAPPGIDELAAVIDVVDAVDSSDSRLIVMDTAPTGHALRLLEMPALVHDWTKALMSILLKYRSVASLQDVGPMLLKLSQGLGRLRTLLADEDRTSFVAITRAAALPHRETLDLLHRLDGLGIHVPAIIVNAVGRGGCRRCRAEAATESRHIARLNKSIPRSAQIVIAPAEIPPPRAPHPLRRWQRRWYLAR